MKHVKFGGQLILMGILLLFWACVLTPFFPIIILFGNPQTKIGEKIDWLCTQPIIFYVNSNLFPNFKQYR